ncbi:ATP-binding protein [Marinibacterium profundimaris]|uniref:histidine kinase n=1 Tax=Marinibacterium profundimaris TaxID=1679460 RepID=A0A225NLE1_9RHOB|nr:ATP-binding protein [Marinibacterium profundimaris]OWU74887.1 histidine kinase [Marinibacterium profundimaris]
MSALRLKHYMPRGLYGRAALILVLPVVLLQLVVSVIFIQRHFEDVTTQMTDTVIRELRLIIGQASAADTPAMAMARMSPTAEVLEFDLAFVAPETIPAADTRLWYDFTGFVMTRTLRGALPRVGPILLDQPRSVTVYYPTPNGPLEIVFDRRRVSASAPHQLLVNMVVFGALMTAVAFLYLRNQLRPIARLAVAATAFGRGQQVAYRPAGSIEVRAAGRAFVDMRHRIERHIEQRTLMLSGVSHDLRTPLTRLTLGLSMMDDPEAKHLLADVREMEALIDAFLDFAKGAQESEPEMLDPHALVARIVEDAQRAGSPVTLCPGEGEGEMLLRPVAIRRAVENLVGNAVRYGERAEVTVRLLPGSLRIVVEDDGPGIPPEAREDAVKAFSRLDPARNQNKGTGVGLGLAIAMDVARAHGGELRLDESERMGGLLAEIVIAR